MSIDSFLSKVRKRGVFDTMKAFPDLDLPHNFDGESRSLVSDFYLPALAVARRYDRAVGYFSSYALTEAAQGLSGLVSNGGKLRLLIGDQLSEEEYTFVKRGKEFSGLFSRLKTELHNILAGAQDDLVVDRLELLSWLVGTNSLEIRFAFRPRGIFHQKLGIMQDGVGNTVAFTGSANETRNALLPDLNDEFTSIYFSWEEEVYSRYGRPIHEKFDKLWENQSRGNIVVEVPSSFYEQLNQYSKRKIPPTQSHELELVAKIEEPTEQRNRPSPPEDIEGKPFSLRPHQRTALEQWRASDFNGILEHATGSGKTITAIWAAVSVYRALGKVFVIIGVPYQALANQWMEELSAFSISATPCYASRGQWEESLEREISDFNSGVSDHLAIVAVNQTLKSSRFRRVLKEVNPTVWGKTSLFIGDECHHYSSVSDTSQLPDAKFRLGLSATPYSHDPDGNTALARYFGDVVSTYSLEQALSDGVLTPYSYHPIKVQLTENEQAEYLRLSAIIASLENQKKDGSTSNAQLQNAYLKRSALLGSCEGKFYALQMLLRDNRVERYTLAYGGAGYIPEIDDDMSAPTSERNIERIISIFKQAGWKISPFTSNESPSQRKHILDSFKFGTVHALASIRVLDEGVDIPGCETAYLLASSRNSRQFIQRRGRVLRKAPGKTESTIYDFVVVPSLSGKVSLKNLVRAELRRAHEFNRLALNEAENEGFIGDLSMAWELSGEDLVEEEFGFNE